MAAEPLLRTDGLHKRFGGVTALDGVSISVPPGAIYGLIGPNGSGKTTLFNVITGFTAADRGSVTFAGKPIDRLQPNQVAARGLVRTFQATLCPARMTVMENMLLAPQRQLGDRLINILARAGAVRRAEKAHLERARELLEIVNLGGKADDYAGSLSGGQRKLLSLAQALMAEPHLVLLDEPVAGVNPRLIGEIGGVIRRLRDRGQNFLIVEHNMTFVRTTCDQVAVLDSGRVIAEGAVGDVLGRDQVLQAYLGHHAGRAGAQAPTP
jgi:ABC-type branched-subunit amino acid transport system ATPase component